MYAQIIRSWKKFYQLETEWSALLSRSGANTIFLSFDWMHAWVSIFSNSVLPYLIIIRDDKSNLVGIAPFYKSKLKILNILPYNTLRIIGDIPTGAEYPSFIAKNSIENKVYETIIECLIKHRYEWDCIWITNLGGWQTSTERLRKYFSSPIFFCNHWIKSFGAIKLPEAVENFNQSLSLNMRQQISRQDRKIKKRKKLSFRKCQKQHELPVFLNALFDLHYKRWHKVGEIGSFKRKPDMVYFYRKFAKYALEKKWLWLYGLSDNNEFKAIQLGYVHNGIYHQLQEGFDPDYIPGVGNVLRKFIIEALITEGIKIYDFLEGMTEHKRRWGAKERSGYDLLIGHRSLKNQLLFIKSISPTGRYLQQTELPTATT